MLCHEPSENFPVYSFKKERKKENNALGYKNHSDLMDSLTGFSEKFPQYVTPATCLTLHLSRTVQGGTGGRESKSQPK